MSASESFQEVWNVYQEAVQELYRAPSSIQPEAERSAGEIYAERLEERSDMLLTRSAEVRQVLTAHVEADDREQRELAALKLLAAAAYDLSTATDLVQLEETEPTDEAERSGANMVQFADELNAVLAAPMEGGMQGLLAGVERSALPKEAEAARQNLERQIAVYLNDIPEDAANLSQTAVAGIITLGLGPLQSTLSLASQEILSRVPDGISAIGRRAAKLVVEALQKIRATIGEEYEDKAREQVSKWLDDLEENRDTVTGLLDKLYELERIGNEVKQLTKAAPDDTEADRFNQATTSLEDLQARYGKVKGILEWVMRVLAFAKAPLMTAVPWGPVAVYATYAGILGYAVFSGGDYLDWYRTGGQEWLDRVKGLRTTVHEALETQA
jgi:hypothetical protein